MLARAHSRRARAREASRRYRARHPRRGRALSELEGLGLISVSRKFGKSPMITILDLPEDLS
jgi:hypothetical protein